MYVLVFQRLRLDFGKTDINFPVESETLTFTSELSDVEL